VNEYLSNLVRRGAGLPLPSATLWRSPAFAVPAAPSISDAHSVPAAQLATGASVVSSPAASAQADMEEGAHDASSEPRLAAPAATPALDPRTATVETTAGEAPPRSLARDRTNFSDPPSTPRAERSPTDAPREMLSPSALPPRRFDEAPGAPSAVDVILDPIVASVPAPAVRTTRSEPKDVRRLSQAVVAPAHPAPADPKLAAGADIESLVPSESVDGDPPGSRASRSTRPVLGGLRRRLGAELRRLGAELTDESHPPSSGRSFPTPETARQASESRGAAVADKQTPVTYESTSATKSADAADAGLMVRSAVAGAERLIVRAEPAPSSPTPRPSERPAPRAQALPVAIRVGTIEVHGPPVAAPLATPAGPAESPPLGFVDYADLRSYAAWER